MIKTKKTGNNKNKITDKRNRNRMWMRPRFRKNKTATAPERKIVIKNRRVKKILKRGRSFPLWIPLKKIEEWRFMILQKRSNSRKKMFPMILRPQAPRKEPLPEKQPPPLLGPHPVLIMMFR